MLMLYGMFIKDDVLRLLLLLLLSFLVQ